jgi:hypothetical protein
MSEKLSVVKARRPKVNKSEIFNNKDDEVILINTKNSDIIDNGFEKTPIYKNSSSKNRNIEMEDLNEVKDNNLRFLFEVLLFVKLICFSDNDSYEEEEDDDGVVSNNEENLNDNSLHVNIVKRLRKNGNKRDLKKNNPVDVESLVRKHKRRNRLFKRNSSSLKKIRNKRIKLESEKHYKMYNQFKDVLSLDRENIVYL